MDARRRDLDRSPAPELWALKRLHRHRPRHVAEMARPHANGLGEEERRDVVLVGAIHVRSEIEIAHGGPLTRADHALHLGRIDAALREEPSLEHRVADAFVKDAEPLRLELTKKLHLLVRLNRTPARASELHDDEVTSRIPSLDQRVGEDEARRVIVGIGVDLREELLDLGAHRLGRLLFAARHGRSRA